MTKRRFPVKSLGLLILVVATATLFIADRQRTQLELDASAATIRGLSDALEAERRRGQEERLALRAEGRVLRKRLLRQLGETETLEKTLERERESAAAERQRAEGLEAELEAARAAAQQASQLARTEQQAAGEQVRSQLDQVAERVVELELALDESVRTEQALRRALEQSHSDALTYGDELAAFVHDQAVTQAAEAVALDREVFAEIFLERGRRLLDGGQLMQAYATLACAQDLAPKLPNLEDELKRALARIDKQMRRTAIVQLHRIDDLRLLGASLQESGRHDEALQAYERLLRLDPSDQAARHAAAECREALRR